uniref:Glucosidase 2 subunit beta n=1 Tax=Ananas comosus var. bracteatus TaxID=296719 RepID=A0A6V7PDP0_ANACO|nr:unnamed protein product [Ananas comosus var. bracteatus]
MRKPHLRLSLLVSCVSLLWIAAFASPPPRESLGIALQDESYYRSSVIKCKDGSKQFTRDQLNDEFCDCPDGTDEPGTSACPGGKFYCRNVGHAPLTIFSSRVNDGICDCCDGTDEYDGKANCQNTCWEAGKAAREKLKKKIATFKDGVAIRNQEVEKAKQAFAKDEAELAKLKNEEKILNGLVEKLKEQKERIEKAEEEERLKKEKEEKRLKEEAEKQAIEDKKATQDSQEGNVDATLEKSPEVQLQEGNDHRTEIEDGNNQENTKSDEGDEVEDQGNIESDIGDDEPIDGLSSTPTLEEHVVESEDDNMIKAASRDDSAAKAASKTSEEQDHAPLDTEGLSKEELGRLIASRWTGENVAPKTDEVRENAKEEGDEYRLDTEIPEPAEESYDGYNSETDEEANRYEEDDFEDERDEEYNEDHVDPADSYYSDEAGKSDHSDLTDSGGSSWLEKIQQKVQSVLQAFNFFKTPVDLSEASHVRKEYDDTSSKLSKLRSRISSLTEKLKHDFGKEKEFYSFYDQCFESKQNKYVYKVCPFKKASQNEGHSSTQLGRWDKFEESYRIMHFSNGDRCWNGPDRSLKVRLRCGLKNELTEVDEPSRCEYVAILSTPLLCYEERLKELQQKLDDMMRQPSTHDEL